MILRDYTTRAKERYLREQIDYNRKLVLIRWGYIAILSIAAIVSGLIDGSSEITSFVMLALVAVTVNFAFWVNLNYLVKHSRSYVQTMSVLQVVADIVLASLIIFSQGGYDSRATVLYAIPLVASGVLFSRALVFLAAFLSGIGYVLAATLNTQLFSDDRFEVLPLVFYPSVFMVISFVVYYLVKSRSSDVAQDAYKEILAMLTHQLDYPLTVIKRVKRTAEEDNSLGKDKLSELLGTIQQANKDTYELAKSLVMDVTEESGRHFERVDIKQLLTEVTDYLSVTHERKKDVKLSLNDEELLVKSNRQYLRIALINVLDNAFKYSKRGTAIEINAHPIDGKLCIEVTNNTSRINAKKIKNIFSATEGGRAQPYISDDSGLGLAVSYRILRDLGGHIDVESNKIGLTVSVVLKRLNHTSDKK